MEHINKKDLHTWTPDQLYIRLNELRRDNLELRVKTVTEHVKSVSSDMRKIKKAIAQILTHIRQRQLGVIDQNQKG